MEDKVTADQHANGAAIRENALAGGIRAEQAFAALYRLYYRRLVVFAAAFKAVPAVEREDAVHEIIVKAFLHLGSYDPARPLAGWVYGLARNYFLDCGRKSKPAQVELDTETIAGDGLPFETRLENREMLELAWSAIQGMSQTDRQIAMLVFYEQLEPSEAARVLEMPAGTLRWRLMNMRKRLRALREAAV